MRESKSFKEAAEAAHTKTVEARKKLVAEIEALDTAEAVSWPKRMKALETLVAAAREAELAWRASADRARAASVASSGASHAYTMARAQLEAALRAGADNEAIDAFTREMRDDEDKSRKAHVGGYTQERPAPFAAPILRGYTNKHDVQRRIAAVRGAVGAPSSSGSNLTSARWPPASRNCGHLCRRSASPFMHRSRPRRRPPDD